MNTNFQIIQSKVDFSFLQAIEQRAAEQYRLVGYDPSIWPTMPISTLEQYYQKQQLWVAVKDNAPVGFVVADIYGNYAHLEEIDVDPMFQRQGIASSLVTAVLQWATEKHLKAVTLRTFKTTPWSISLYTKLGFEITEEKINHICSLVANEQSIGLPVADRITMIK
jgi:ribosomal protein S18 acetylase RimI-like enzyme